MFKVVKCPPEYIEIRKRLRAQETALDTIQAPSIQDRTINDHLSMFVEVKNGKKNHRAGQTNRRGFVFRWHGFGHAARFQDPSEHDVRRPRSESGNGKTILLRKID